MPSIEQQTPKNSIGEGKFKLYFKTEFIPTSLEQLNYALRREVREEMGKLCTQTAEILSWRVGALNSSLFPLIFIWISAFFRGEMFYSVPLLTFSNGYEVK